MAECCEMHAARAWPSMSSAEHPVVAISIVRPPYWSRSPARERVKPSSAPWTVRATDVRSLSIDAGIRTEKQRQKRPLFDVAVVNVSNQAEQFPAAAVWGVDPVD